MVLKKFKQIIQMYQDILEERDKFDEIGFSIDAPIFNYIDSMFDMLLHAYLTDDGVDWVYWWLLEPGNKAYNKDGSEIKTDTIEDLYKLLEPYFLLTNVTKIPIK